VVQSFDNENWEYTEDPFKTGLNYYAFILLDTKKSIHPKRYIEGWSPSLNFTTEAFFGNFQSGHIKWSELWPNTIIPISETTDTRYLEECCIIEVDFDSVEESTHNIVQVTPRPVLANNNIVGELTCLSSAGTTKQAT
jgi:hypothetical protein